MFGRFAARRILLVGLVTIGLCLSGCGSKQSSNPASQGSGTAPATTTTAPVHLAKTKFVLHAGLAFGAFHHFIFKPLRAGELNHPFSHKLTVIKAGLAALFVYHELKLALHDAQGDPTLSKLVAPITALQSKLSGLVSGIRSGHPDSAGIESANGSIGAIHGLAGRAGQSISEQVPSTL